MSKFNLINKFVLILLFLLLFANTTRAIELNLDNSGGGIWKEYVSFPVITTPYDGEIRCLRIEGSNWRLENELSHLDAGLKNPNFWEYVKSDGTDIRVFDENGNQLYFWIEKFDYLNKTAVIWIRLTGNINELNIAYGNPNATMSLYHDPEKVFIFFDDFTGESIDTNKWLVFNGLGASIEVKNSKLIMKYEGGAYDIAFIESDYVIQTDVGIGIVVWWKGKIHAEVGHKGVGLEFITPDNWCVRVCRHDTGAGADPKIVLAGKFNSDPIPPPDRPADFPERDEYYPVPNPWETTMRLVIRQDSLFKTWLDILDLGVKLELSYYLLDPVKVRIYVASWGSYGSNLAYLELDYIYAIPFCLHADFDNGKVVSLTQSKEGEITVIFVDEDGHPIDLSKFEYVKVNGKDLKDYKLSINISECKKIIIEFDGCIHTIDLELCKLFIHNSTLKVELPSERHRVVLVSSKQLDVVVRNVYSKAIVISDRIASYTLNYQAYSLKFYVSSKTYDILIIRNNESIVLGSLHGGNLTIYVDLLRPKRGYAFGETVAISKVYDNLTSITYVNPRFDNVKLELRIYDGNTLIFNYTEEANPNMVTLHLSHTHLNLSSDKVYKLVVVAWKPDGTVKEITRYFMLDGRSGLADSKVIAILSMMTALFGLMLTPTRYGSIVVFLFALGLTALAVVTWYIMLIQVVLLILLIYYVIITIKRESSLR